MPKFTWPLATRRYGDKTYRTHLLRRTFRQDGKVKHETLGNVSSPARPRTRSGPAQRSRERRWSQQRSRLHLHPQPASRPRPTAGGGHLRARVGLPPVGCPATLDAEA